MSDYDAEVERLLRRRQEVQAYLDEVVPSIRNLMMRLQGHRSILASRNEQIQTLIKGTADGSDQRIFEFVAAAHHELDRAFFELQLALQDCARF